MRGDAARIETALPSVIGQAPIFRSFGPQKMAGGEGDEPDRPPTPTSRPGWRCGVPRSWETGTGGRDVPVESPSASNVNTSASVGHPGGGQGVGKVWCRPAAAGDRGAGSPEEGSAGGGHRRWPAASKNARASASQHVGSPTGREWPPRPPVGGHDGDTSRRGPGRRRSAKASSASAIWPRRPSSTARAWPTHPRISQYTVRPEAPPRPPRLAHRRGRGHGKDAHRPRLGAVTGVPRNSPYPRRARPGPADGPPGPATAAPAP